MSYATKLTDPRWQKKRLEIFQRDDFKCQLCRDKEATLHVHHKSYKRNTEPWDYPNENFETYCEACHGVVESLKEESGFQEAFSCKKLSKNMTSMCFMVFKKDGKFYYAVVAYYKDLKTTKKYFEMPEFLMLDGLEVIELVKTKFNG